ncbi:uncharacterized protein [Antennarius striatus]|uniref:uncharacterized protein n=1 Tax=Antennarius striatus TaxID=241820 RepID=UPI0035AE1E4A
MEMYVLCILALMCEFLLGVPVPIDTVIVQVQQRAVVGSQQVMDQVLLNGVVVTDKSQYFESIIQSIPSDKHLLTLAMINQTSVLRNHTLLRSRECILEGSQRQWRDRVFLDGMVYLSLDHNDKWTAHVRPAQVLKELWEQEEQRTKSERIHLQEGCITLMTELRLSEEQPDHGSPWPKFLIPGLAFLVFVVLVMISLLLSKKLGLRHPGGVTGSVIHYPKDMTETATGVKGSGYHAL